MRGQTLIASGLATATAVGVSYSNYIVKLANGSQYRFFISTNIDLYWTKSTDGGISWSDPALIQAGNADAISVWFDQWTPGDTGTKIHIAWIENNTDDCTYNSLDTASDTLGTEVDVFAGASVVSGNNICVAITKARGGNLLVYFDLDGGTETGFYKSTDSGASFSVMTNLTGIGGADQVLLFPGFAADSQDIIAIQWDVSANEIFRQLYDDSGNSWTQTSISASMTETTGTQGSPDFAGAVDHTNSQIVLVAWTAGSTLNADLKCWTITESAITAKTDVVTNSVENQGNAALTIDKNTGVWTAFYLGKTDGSQNWPSSCGVYYRQSTDGGATWSAETDTGHSVRGYFNLASQPVFFGGWVPLSAGAYNVVGGAGAMWCWANVALDPQTKVIQSIGTY